MGSNLLFIKGANFSVLKILYDMCFGGVGNSKDF
jgi:hypothetical protein